MHHLPLQTIDTTTTIATPLLWAITLGGVVALMALDFVITRKPHEVSMREAIGWSMFYIALPLAFGIWVWSAHGDQTGLQYYTGYLVEKTLSVDNLFIFILILTSFVVPRHLQQRVLLFGIAGALVLRGIFIALGAQLLSNFDAMFLVFGAILVFTAVGVLRDTLRGGHDMDVHELKIVRLAKRIWPVTDDYRGTALMVREGGRRMITPLLLVMLAILGTDVVFAVDSVPAVYGITGDPYLVFVTNAFALLGLRALYFVLEGALGQLRHLGYGLAVILAFIGAKLALHWAHNVWEWVPTVPTLASLIVIVSVLAIVTATSLIAERRERRTGVEAQEDGSEARR
ncbi:TerC family protein [soil metagenome]